MHTLKSILSGLFLLFSISLIAQKKDAVTDLPYSNKTEISDQVLESLFQSTGKISINLAPGFRLEGNIQNKSYHEDSVISLLIKLENREGALLSITRFKEPNGHLFYSGNLLKLHDAEGLVLTEKDNHYYFIETQQRFLVSE
ncbi:MAG TPA: hypothetical protein VII28_14125 [Puia sp.]